ncbi:MAG: EcsC family protein [Oscillospiraceae bacterium]|nr:EcsC family protein [Oscillospiraceae bacterium]
MLSIRKALKQVKWESILVSAMRTPGVKINREEYLRKTLTIYFPDVMLKKAIEANPAKAGMNRHVINRISRREIRAETAKVVGTAAATTLPGGVAGVGGAVADLSAYFIFLLRVMQKLAYLYGFDEFKLGGEEPDSETMSCIVLFLGVMFGVHGASDTLKKMTNIISRSVSKSLSRKAFATSLVYPIAQRLTEAIGLRITRQLFSELLAAIVPLFGAAFAGVLTFLLFRPCCFRLRNQLMHENISDPDYYARMAAESSSGQGKENVL